MVRTIYKIVFSIERALENIPLDIFSFIQDWKHLAVCKMDSLWTIKLEIIHPQVLINTFECTHQFSPKFFQTLVK